MRKLNLILAVLAIAACDRAVTDVPGMTDVMEAQSYVSSLADFSDVAAVVGVIDATVLDGIDMDNALAIPRFDAEGRVRDMRVLARRGDLGPWYTDPFGTDRPADAPPDARYSVRGGTTFYPLDAETVKLTDGLRSITVNRSDVDRGNFLHTADGAIWSHDSAGNWTRHTVDGSVTRVASVRPWMLDDAIGDRLLLAHRENRTTKRVRVVKVELK